jgi:hypothetical protein
LPGHIQRDPAWRNGTVLFEKAVAGAGVPFAKPGKAAGTDDKSLDFTVRSGQNVLQIADGLAGRVRHSESAVKLALESL